MSLISLMRTIKNFSSVCLRPLFICRCIVVILNMRKSWIFSLYSRGCCRYVTCKCTKVRESLSSRFLLIIRPPNSYRIIKTVEHQQRKKSFANCYFDFVTWKCFWIINISLRILFCGKKLYRGEESEGVKPFNGFLWMNFLLAQFLFHKKSH